MWERSDNQEVGLEAAILERKRNSSLVKRACAENVTGLKHRTEATACKLLRGFAGVGEHTLCGEGGSKELLERKEELMPV